MLSDINEGNGQVLSIKILHKIIYCSTTLLSPYHFILKQKVYDDHVGFYWTKSYDLTTINAAAPVQHSDESNLCQSILLLSYCHGVTLTCHIIKEG